MNLNLNFEQFFNYKIALTANGERSIYYGLGYCAVSFLVVRLAISPFLFYQRRNTEVVYNIQKVSGILLKIFIFYLCYFFIYSTAVSFTPESIESLFCTPRKG
jgi:hypothetical protein